jgi:UDP-N-acetylglucosamine 3-dehydrogenase
VTERAPAPGILIVGSGQAARLHSKLLSKHHPGVRLAYWGRSPGPTRALGRDFGGDHFESWEEALRDDRLDAVFVTTPPDTHRDIAVEALDAGKHAIVEKPAFLTPEEFDDVEAAAARGGRQVLVAENYYYKPLLRRIVGIIVAGELGQVRLLCLNAVKQQSADGWRADPARAGGGALFEGGIHWVSFMASLGLEIRRVEGFFPDAPPGHERSAVFVAEYAQGAVGVLSYSWEIPSTLRGLRLSRIYGTRSSLLFESNGLFLLRGGPRPRLCALGVSDIQGYRAMLADFVRVLSVGGRPEFTLADARRDVELVLSTYTENTSPISTENHP